MKDTHDGLRDLFKHILGSDVSIKDNIKSSEKAFFCLIISKLDEAHKNDERLFELAGIDLTKPQNNLWVVIEALLKLTYGVYAFDLIMWYILDRFNPDGKVVPFEDEKGNKTSVVTATDLYNFIKHRFPAE
tara:strand:+ start:1401 stop:1793 length:393 start_codon:yes stop_codon:yes gene_type:complete